ncbi:MAG TPA: hypothetical protein VFG69_03265, partial [Nannocystaceae bacterium]|nr:hypothetical protein [Nannocystaceae bacterium]
LSAASGLVRTGAEIVVIADDELVLHRYALDGTPRGELRLFAGELPAEPVARKAAKPDLETLSALPDGRLLALGSCSRPWRERAVLVDRDAVVEVDLGPIARALADRFDRVNIEGACVLGSQLLMATRRTGATGRNAIVRLDLARVLAMLDAAPARIETTALVDVLEIELGAEQGVPFGFTDAAAWNGGVLFCAAAENTDDPVDDGICVACTIGWLDASFEVRRRWSVTPRAKIEGIAVGDDDVLYAVADADDRGVLAPLFRAALER